MIFRPVSGGDLLHPFYTELLDFCGRPRRSISHQRRLNLREDGIISGAVSVAATIFLMDCFFNAVPYRRKKRIHSMPSCSKSIEFGSLQGETDPMMKVAAKIAS